MQRFFDPQKPFGLRLPGTHGAKINEKQIPLHVSLINSVTTCRPSFKNLRSFFFTKWPLMSKVCLHVKGEAEIQNGRICCFFFLILLISALTLEVIFECKHTFGILAHLVKNAPHIF